MRRAILRALLIVTAAAPLVACNTVQNELGGETFAALSDKADQAAPAKGRKIAAKTATSKDAGRYFVEFRSRYAISYGHTFLVHGRLNEKGEIGELSAKNVAGFHPLGETPTFWMIGHLVPVPSETGPSDGDLEEQYVSARYRVYLSESEYAKVAAFIKAKQASLTPWHAAMYNCNLWIADIARYMGLKAPESHWLYPANYINRMRELNEPQVTASAEPALTAQ